MHVEFRDYTYKLVDNGEKRKVVTDNHYAPSGTPSQQWSCMLFDKPEAVSRLVSPSTTGH